MANPVGLIGNSIYGKYPALKPLGQVKQLCLTSSVALFTALCIEQKEKSVQNTPRSLIQQEPESACKAVKPTRLYKRLEEALHTGSEVWFRMPGTRLVGIPIYLDSDYVEVVDVDVAEGYEDDELPDDPYQRTVWLIRLAEISAISYATDRWSKDRFERLLDQSDEPKNS